VSNGSYVAVINASTRDRFFGGPPAVGRTLEADGQHFTVIGVVPDVPILRTVSFAELYVPVTTSKTDAYRDELVGSFTGLLLARSPADFPAIKAEFASRLHQVPLPNARWEKLTSRASTLFEYAADMLIPGEALETKPALLWAVIAGTMLLFALLPAVNLVNLNMSRIMERASEIGVRKAFGASSRTLVGQFIVENVVLALLGGILGFAGSVLVLEAVNRSGLVPYALFAMNYRIFLCGLGLAVFFGVLSGVYPAWRMSRLHPVQALKGASR
jgi:putative ABC transport system permease protein